MFHAYATKPSSMWLHGAVTDSMPVSALYLILHGLMCAACAGHAVTLRPAMQARKERRKRFLDYNLAPLTIDEAHDILLDVSEDQFKRNIQKWGAIHTEPCRSVLPCHSHTHSLAPYQHCQAFWLRHCYKSFEFVECVANLMSSSGPCQLPDSS